MNSCKLFISGRDLSHKSIDYDIEESRRESTRQSGQKTKEGTKSSRSVADIILIQK